MRYIRVLPIMIITAFGLLSFRVHNIWQSANVEQHFSDNNSSDVVRLEKRITSTKKNVDSQTHGHSHKNHNLIDFNSAKAEDTKPATPPANANNTPNSKISNAKTSKEMEDNDPQFMSEEEITVLTKLSNRRRELDKRSTELDRKEKFMTAAELRIDKKINEMKQLEKSINAKIKEADAKHEKDIKSLVKVYEGMKPADAANIFEDLEPDVLITLVDNMKQKSLASILSAMDPVKAREITVELARKKDLTDL